MVEGEEWPYRPPSEWFEFGDEDFLSAKLLFNSRGPSSIIGMLVQQAVEKYLKGYLIGHGWELIKTHNIEFLLGQAARFDARFEAFFDFGKAATALYAEDRYPFINRQDVPVVRLREMIEEGDRLVEIAKSLDAN